MRLQNDFTYLWSIIKGLKTRDDYIPMELDNPYELSSSKKDTAKKAIIWLLSKAPHSTEEIADHFKLSPRLVRHLLRELTDSSVIVKETANSKRFKVNKSIQRVGEVS